MTGAYAHAGSRRPRPTTRTRDRRAAGDDGATIFLYASLLGPLLILTAIVVDLGLARATKQNLKASTDLAAVAAGFFLAGDGGASPVSNPQLACSAAFASFKANLGDLAASSTLSPSCAENFPTNAHNCSDSSTPKRTSTSVGSPGYTVSIDYPVPASDIADPLLANGSGSADGPSRCSRMRVSIARTNTPIFGGILSNKGLTISASSVVKAGLSPNGIAAPAILLLERSNCGTLVASGQGGVRVRGAVTSGGWIHSDSAAGGVGSLTSTNCQGGLSCGANNYNVVGSALPSGAGGGPSITAESSSGSSGKIGMYSLFPRINGASGCEYPGGLSVAPTADPIVGRTPVDLRYNSQYNQTGAAITSLHGTGYASTVGSAPSGYAVVTGSACGQDNTVWQATSVFIDCRGNSGFSGKNVVFRASRVIMTGPLNVSGGYVAFPNARSISIRGCTGCAQGLSVSSSGFLSVNSGEAVSAKWTMVSALEGAPDGVAGAAPAAWPRVDCLADRGAGMPATTLATFAGSFSIQNASANLCQTFVYIGHDAPTYAPFTETSGGNCTASLPCPSASPPSKPVFTLNSGSSPALSWTAPSQNLSGTSVSSPFDGLAVWTEGGGASCSISGQGTLSTSGVFFFPNCHFTYAGQADGNIPLAAQFIGRTLTMSGQGILALQPDPKRSVAVAAPGTVELIR